MPDAINGLFCAALQGPVLFYSAWYRFLHLDIPRQKRTHSFDSLIERNLYNDNSGTNWRLITQTDNVCSAVGYSEMEVDPNWRNDFPLESRRRIVNRIKHILEPRMRNNNNKGMVELENFAFMFENKFYSAAASKEDYMLKISSSLKKLETTIQGQTTNPLPGNSSGCDQKLPDSATPVIQPSHVQAWPQLLSENMQSSITQGSAGFASALSTMPGLSQAGIPTIGGQTTGMTNMSRVSQNSVNNSTGQVLSQNTLLANSPRCQLQARQPQQQQKQTQSQHHVIYQQQPPAVLMQNVQAQSHLQPSVQQQSHLQPSVQQQSQPQQSFLEQKQQHQQPPAHVQLPQRVQSAQQSIVQSSQQSGYQQTAVLQQTKQPVQQSQQSTRQTVTQFALHQLQKPVYRQNQSVQHSVAQQQQPMGQQPALHSQHQHMGKPNDVLHSQQQIFEHPKSGNMNQTLQPSQALLQAHSQHSQQQLQKYPQLHSQLQSQPQQLQQQSLLQQPHSNQQDLQQPHSNQQDLQHRVQTSDSLLQQQNIPEQYNQPSQQRGLQDVSSTSINSSGQTGWRTVDDEDQQEKMYQKLQGLKEAYYPKLKEMHNQLVEKCQQFFPGEQLERIKKTRNVVQQLMAYLQQKRDNRQVFNEDKFLKLEKQMNYFIDNYMSRKPISQQHEGQQQLQSQTSNKVQPVKQSPQPQIPQVQQPDKNAFQQQQLSSQASLVPIQHGSANMLQQTASMSLQQNMIKSVPLNSNSSQQQKRALVQKQDHHQHLIQAKQLKQLQQSQKQHPLFHQHQQEQMQHQQKNHHVAQQAQTKTQQTAQVQLRSDINSEVKAKLTATFKPASVKHQQLGQVSVYQPQRQQHQPFNDTASLPSSSPHHFQDSSQVSQHFTPQIDKQSLITSSPQLPKIETPVQPAASPCLPSSPSTLPMPSTLMENVDTKSSPVVYSVSNTGSAQGLQQSVTTSANGQTLTIGTPGISASPLLGTSSPNLAQNLVSQDGSQTMSPGFMMDEKQAAEAPIERLVKGIRSMSPVTFNSAVSGLHAVYNLYDSMVGSAPGRRSNAAIGEDLVAMTRCRLQASNFMSLDSSAAKRLRHCMSSLPLTVASSGRSLDDSPHQMTDLESSEMLSTATSTAKRPRLELDRVLQLEIRDVNKQLIETVVDLSDNDMDSASCGGSDGIVVKCSYNAMAFRRRLNSGYKQAHKSLISPLWLLIPLSYPKCSPVVLNRFPVETVETIKDHEDQDLSLKTKALFDVSVCNLPEPMTLGTLARTWDVCARNVVAEYAHQMGGGNFSSKYGAWEYCISA